MPILIGEKIAVLVADDRRAGGVEAMLPLFLALRGGVCNAAGNKDVFELPRRRETGGRRKDASGSLASIRRPSTVEAYFAISQVNVHGIGPVQVSYGYMAYTRGAAVAAEKRPVWSTDGGAEGWLSVYHTNDADS